MVADAGAAAMKSPLHPWRAERALSSQMTAFARYIGKETGRDVSDYAALHAVSIADVGAFWAHFVAWSGIHASGSPLPACVGDDVETSRFFPNLRLSWVENVLRAEVEEDAIALIARDETGGRTELAWRDLRLRVRSLAAALAAGGLAQGDRVVAVVCNTIDTVVACLAVTSLGAIWASVAPDMGTDAALRRFLQLQPKLLFAHTDASSNGVRLTIPRAALAEGLPTLEWVVSIEDDAPAIARADQRAATLGELEREGTRLAPDPAAPFQRFPFDQPLFVLFSSGTTGAPKCIVHGHGGTLLEHLKEHRLHGDLAPRDRLLFHTSTGWMMWNWTVSALAAGTALVLYDGSVSHPTRDALLRVAAEEEATLLGMSPAYLQYLVEAGVSNQRGLLTSVREMFSTGSVLPSHLHRWAREHLADVPLQSISGGTDILGCFVLGSPWTATYEGESSCIGLGLDVRAWSDHGPTRRGRGELICARPFPSRPITFFADPEGVRFHETYFSQHDGVWTHGDLIELTSYGTARVLGRCDGMLNIRGIRIGPAEIYAVLAETTAEVTAAIAVDQDAPHESGGKRLVLFVVLRAGLSLDRPLTFRIKKELKQRASAAHVPAVVVQVDELPTTFNGKRSEVALQDALNGRDVRNRAALRNPSSIDEALHRLHLMVEHSTGREPQMDDRISVARVDIANLHAASGRLDAAPQAGEAVVLRECRAHDPSTDVDRKT
jgi:acetoacetyl-CoA synthetase